MNVDPINIMKDWNEEYTFLQDKSHHQFVQNDPNRIHAINMQFRNVKIM